MAIMALGSLEWRKGGHWREWGQKECGTVAVMQCTVRTLIISIFNGVFGGGVLLLPILPLMPPISSQMWCHVCTFPGQKGQDSQVCVVSIQTLERNFCNPRIFTFLPANLPAHTNWRSLLGTSEAIIEAFNCFQNDAFLVWWWWSIWGEVLRAAWKCAHITSCIALMFEQLFRWRFKFNLIVLCCKSNQSIVKLITFACWITCTWSIALCCSFFLSNLIKALTSTASLTCHSAINSSWSNKE